MVDPDGVLAFCEASAGAWTPYGYDVRLKRLAATLSAISRGGHLDWLLARFRPRGMERMLGRRLRRRYGGIDAEGSCPGFSDYASELLGKLSEFEFPGTWVGAHAFSRTSMAYMRPQHQEAVAAVCGEFYRNVMSAMTRTAGCSHCIDKNTWNILWFDRFRRLVPGIKLIHVYRDPCDVVASFLTQEWMPDDPAQAATIYRDIIERWWAIRDGLPSDSFYETSLEELTKDPAEISRQMCAFIGVEFDSTLLDIDLSRGNVGRWRERIPEDSHERVNEILRPVRTRLGYSG